MVAPVVARKLLDAAVVGWVLMELKRMVLSPLAFITCASGTAAAAPCASSSAGSAARLSVFMTAARGAWRAEPQERLQPALLLRGAGA